MQPTTAPATATFITAMTERMAEAARRLADWAGSEPRTLEALEQQALALVKDLGNALLAGVCRVVAAAPAEAPTCACGRRCTTPRQRRAQVLTVLGPITMARPYYHCSACHQGTAPLDRQLGLCAGGVSAGLDELLALLGAREDSFESAAGVLQKLTLIQVCPNTVRAATERLGATLAGVEQARVAQAWAPAAPVLPPEPLAASARLYLSMDGTLIHTHDGWKEVKLGAVYTTAAVVPRRRPQQVEVRARQITFLADLAEPQPFGQALWLEAARRGVLTAQEVVAIGDGAHWIWNLVAEHFPQATQIVDWYHAAQYVWKVAHAVYGEGTDLAQRWADARLEDLWDGKVEEVLAAFAAQRSAGKAVAEAITYVTNNRERMRYPDYRARGLQVGSGTIESGCKHVLGARLKQAGMIWEVEGARAVAKVRAWLKSGRWDEAMALRQPPRRTYRRRIA